MTADAGTQITTIAGLGAFGFGAMVGWYTYYVNRYRKGDVALSDLTTIVGVIGGGAITALFDAKGPLFGSYGIGLFAGFFGYFAVLLWLVSRSGGAFTTSVLEFEAPSPRSRLSELIEQQRLARAAAEDADVDLTKLIGLAVDPKKRQKLEEAQTKLREELLKLRALQLRDIFDSREVNNAFNALRQANADLATAANQMRDATNAIATAAKVIGYLEKVIGFIVKLVL